MFSIEISLNENRQYRNEYAQAVQALTHKVISNPQADDNEELGIYYTYIGYGRVENTQRSNELQIRRRVENAIRIVERTNGHLRMNITRHMPRTHDYEYPLAGTDIITQYAERQAELEVRMRRNPVVQLARRHQMPFILGVIITHTGDNETRERFNRAVWIASTETEATVYIHTTVSNPDEVEIRYMGMIEQPRAQA